MKSALKKIIIIGNSGSGKTFLAQKLAAVLNLPVTHLDRLFWESESCLLKRSKEIVHQEIAELTEQPKWIVEGVFGELANIGIYNADTLIFLNKDWDECSQALELRGSKNASEESFKELLNWAGLYWDRKSSSSFEFHKIIFDQFAGTKLELRSREEVEQWLSNLAHSDKT